MEKKTNSEPMIDRHFARFRLYDSTLHHDDEKTISNTLGQISTSDRVIITKATTLVRLVRSTHLNRHPIGCTIRSQWDDLIVDSAASQPMTRFRNSCLMIQLEYLAAAIYVNEPNSDMILIIRR